MSRPLVFIRATTIVCSTRLHRLRDLGNTVLVVEHDAETIERADYVIDLGPAPAGSAVECRRAGTPAQIKTIAGIAHRTVSVRREQKSHLLHPPRLATGSSSS